jgi:hypothetical protein
MRTSAKSLVPLVLGLLCCAAATARAQTSGDRRWENGVGEAWSFESEHYTKEQAAAARDLWERIGAGKDEARDSFAGDYLIDMSVRLHALRWSAGAGFVFFNVNTCMANVDRLDYGEVVSDTPEYVVLASKLRPGASDKRKYVKVRWGAQRYLIDERRVANFCDYVAGLGAYNESATAGYEFLPHSADGDQPTAVLPTVPAEYRELVRRPIDAAITRVGKPYVEADPENEWWDKRVTPVAIDAGSSHGLKRGMKIHILDSDEFDENVEVTRVGRTSARGIVVRTVRKRPGVKINEWDDGKDLPEQPIAAGWRLTTGLHERALRSDARHAAWEAMQDKK